MLRRTKNMTDRFGQAILVLPKKFVHIEYVELEVSEREFYSEIVNRSKAVYGGLEANGHINSKYAALFTLLMRMRQACDHPYLVCKSTSSDSCCNDNNNVDDDTIIHEDNANEEDNIGKKFLEELYKKLNYNINLNNNQNNKNSVEDKENDIDIQNFKINKENHVDLDDISVNTIDIDSNKDIDLVKNIGFLNEIKNSLTNSSYIECPICLIDIPIIDACITNCGHIYCYECAYSTISITKQCSICSYSLDVCDIVKLDKLNNSNNKKVTYNNNKVDKTIDIDIDVNNDADSDIMVVSDENLTRIALDEQIDKAGDIDIDKDLDNTKSKKSEHFNATNITNCYISSANSGNSSFYSIGISTYIHAFIQSYLFYSSIYFLELTNHNQSVSIFI